MLPARTLAVAIFSAGLLLAAQTANAATGCPVSDKEFLHQITTSKDWADVYAVFKHNLPACQDEGLYADGYTNLVVEVLATRWQEIDTLDDLMLRDEAFGQFVLRHIGMSAGEEHLHKVLLSAQASCTKKSVRLCKKIAARCKLALSESGK